MVGKELKAVRNVVQYLWFAEARGH